MSREKVEIVRRVYERWGDGDFRASLGLLDPHVVLVLGPEFGPESDAGVYYGIEEVAAYTRRMLEPWATFTQEAKEIVATAGDSVLVEVRQRAVGDTSGVPTEMNYFTLWTFRGRAVIRIESFRERAEALKAAGLSE